MNLEETYDKIAENWHRDHLLDDWWIEGTNKFILYLPAGGRILDVGCGSGVKSKYFLEHGFQVTGIDISQKLLDIAKRESSKGDFRHLSMTDLDTMSEHFDGVFAQASLLHIPKAEAADVVKKMAGRLKPGGYAYVAVKESHSGRPEEAVEKENDYGFEYERFFSYFSMDELRDYFSKAGLKVATEIKNASPSGKTIWLQVIGQK